MHDATAIETYRREKDTFYKTHPSSPLDPNQQAAFAGLRYYPHDPAYTFVVEAERLNNETVTLDTTSGEPRQYRRYARFTFSAPGESDAALTVYETPHGYFLPFTDRAEDTYGGGRYLDLELIDETHESARFEVDFNLAYNPYCAFSDGYSCPIVPMENRLAIAIRAGEQSPT